MRKILYYKHYLLLCLLVTGLFSCQKTPSKNNLESYNTNLFFSITNTEQDKSFLANFTFICKTKKAEKKFHYSVNPKNSEIYLPEIDDKSSCSLVINKFNYSNNINYTNNNPNKNEDSKEIIYTYTKKQVSFKGNIKLKINNSSYLTFFIMTEKKQNKNNLTFVLRKTEAQEVNSFSGISLERINNTYAFLFIDKNTPTKTKLEIKKIDSKNNNFKVISAKEVPTEIKNKTNIPYCDFTAISHCYFLIENENNSTDSQATLQLKDENDIYEYVVNKRVTEYFISESDNLFCYGVIKKVENNVSCLSLNSSLFEEIKINRNAKILMDSNNILHLLISSRIFKFQQKAANSWTEILEEELKHKLISLNWHEFQPTSEIKDKELGKKLSKLFTSNTNVADHYQALNTWTLEQSFKESLVYSNIFNVASKIEARYQQNSPAQHLILIPSHYKEFKKFDSFVLFNFLQENYYFYETITSQPPQENGVNSNLPVSLRASFSCNGKYSIPINSSRYCNFFSENTPERHSIFNLFFNYEDNAEFIDFLKHSSVPIEKEFELFIYTNEDHKYYLVGKLNFKLTFSFKNKELQISSLTPADLHFKKCQAVAINIPNNSNPGLNINVQCQ